MSTVAIHASEFFEPGVYPIITLRCTTPKVFDPDDFAGIPHTHDFNELVILTEGSAIHSIDGVDYPVGAGDVFLLQDQQTHHFYDRKDLVMINIMYDPKRLPLPTEEFRKLPGYSTIFVIEPNARRTRSFSSHLRLKGKAFAQARDICEDLLRETIWQPTGFEAAILGHLVQLIVFLSRQPIREGEDDEALLRVGHAIAAVESDCCHPWHLGELARITHMSRSNFNRVFRQATGLSPIEYLIRVRIQKAMKLLRESDLNITQTANAVGFDDSNYFTRQFRKIANLSPTAYRKRSRAALAAF